MDDLLASLDTVEFADSDDFMGGFEKESLSSSEEDSLSLQEENQSEELTLSEVSQAQSNEFNLREEDEDSDNVAVKPQAFNLNHNFESQEVFGENSIIPETSTHVFSGKLQEDTYAEVKERNYEPQYEKTDNKTIKTFSGAAVAGVVITVAIALWLNNKQIIPNSTSALVSPVMQNSTALPPPPQPAKQNSSQNSTAGKKDTVPPVKQKTAVNKQTDASSERNLNADLTNSFTRRNYEVDIRNISWEITVDMAENALFKNYIMVTGQVLKSSLARDLALVKERALSSKMEIKTVFGADGSVLDTTVIKSSGSDEVDKVCLATYKATLQFTKMPKIDAGKDKINANLIIEF